MIREALLLLNKIKLAPHAYERNLYIKQLSKHLKKIGKEYEESNRNKIG